MRTKDDQKRQSLLKATIKLVNEVGFAASSVSKIAKQANVSPSTLYVFFDNKEDLLVSTYLEIKYDLAKVLLNDFDDTLPIRDVIKKGWLGVFKWVSRNPQEYGYIEQFSNSPFNGLVDREKLETEYLPFIQVIQRGIDQKIIKDVDQTLISAFLFSPISKLANPMFCQNFKGGGPELDLAFTMAWDAIKL